MENRFGDDTENLYIRGYCTGCSNDLLSRRGAQVVAVYNQLANRQLASVFFLFLFVFFVIGEKVNIFLFVLLFPAGMRL